MPFSSKTQKLERIASPFQTSSLNLKKIQYFVKIKTRAYKCESINLPGTLEGAPTFECGLQAHFKKSFYFYLSIDFNLFFIEV